MNLIEQGETFGFETGLTGPDTDSFTTTINVLQFPGDTPAITRSVSGMVETLTSAETAALAVGQWFIHIKSEDSDEDIRMPVKLYISKGWL